jgi:O-acetyl-ADP-ribose deacetylase (regulator of RNase III)
VSARIEVMKADITERSTDAIVNPTNSMLILGSGLAGAIKAKGGESIAAECASQGPAPIGSAVLTGAGELKASHIIHVVLSEFDGSISEEALDSALRACLQIAEKKRFKSISFPHPGTGIAPLPVERSAQVLFTVLADYLKKKSQLELIEIILQDIDTLRVYKKTHAEFIG